MCFRKRKTLLTQKQVNLDFSEWYFALGGEDNILEIEGKGQSRISVTLKDKKLVNKDKLSVLGVTSTIEMSNKIILVVENANEKILKGLKK